MGQVIPLHTEFLSEAEIDRLELHTGSRRRTWSEWATEYGGALALGGSFGFWVIVGFIVWVL